MKTTNLTVPVPEDILLSLRVNHEDFVSQLLLMSAMMFYKTQKLSVGQAANLA
ncbi:MAG: UPF0175 family protein, partial [Clostridium sp.]|nr:UPF0175 family protein [Clostridium sp.]